MNEDIDSPSLASWGSPMKSFAFLAWIGLFLIAERPSHGQDQSSGPTQPALKSVEDPQAQPSPAPKSKPPSRASSRQAPTDPHAPWGQGVRDGSFMGRRLAEVMSWLGADWLVRPEREIEEEPERMLDALELKPGMVVADVGAGVGFTSVRLARRVGPEGKVLATDVQPEMIRLLKQNLVDLGVKNVSPVLCTPQEPGLPEGQVDLAIMVDVYHECSHPVETLSGIRKALKPGGRLVLVEFRAEDPDVPIKPEHKMTVAQVRQELEPAGFMLQKQHEFLPWQHILVFEKSGAALEGKPGPKVAPVPLREP